MYYTRFLNTGLPFLPTLVVIFHQLLLVFCHKKPQLKLENSVDRYWPSCYNTGMFSKKEFKMLDMEPMTRQEELHMASQKTLRD